MHEHRTMFVFKMLSRVVKMILTVLFHLRYFQLPVIHCYYLISQSSGKINLLEGFV